MFGYQGGESPGSITCKTGHRDEAKRQRRRLTTLDLSGIEDEAQLISPL